MNRIDNIIKIAIFIAVFLLSGLSQAAAQAPASREWTFDNLDGWDYGHQDDNPDNQTVLQDGVVKMYTRANSRDRKKIRTADKIYTTGRYTWRAFISDLGKGDQASIGTWIYHDDEHEIDFEIGYGKEEVRKQLSASPDDVVAYMTTQANPFQSTPVLIKKGWNIFEIDLSLVDGNYLLKWLINGVTVSTVQQTFGREYPFYIFCSVENLTFIGDNLPQQDNYGLFDYVKYEYHD